MRRINSRILISLILIVIGIFLILYALHHMHTQIVTGKEPFFYGVRDWFVSVGDWFKGLAASKETAPSHSLTSMKAMYWIGIILTLLGVISFFFRRKKN
jgi:LPXTG-motif cell wall-anchored protein